MKVKKLFGTIIMMILSFLLITGTSAMASPKAPENITLPYQTEGKKDNTHFYFISDSSSKTVVKDLKSSNKKVVTAFFDKTQPNFIGFKTKKAGTANVTGVLYEGKKNIGKFTVNVKVYKYKSPVKSFKLGKNNYSSKLRKRQIVRIKKSGKCKVKIKEKTGWKLSVIRYYNGKKWKTIKNGASVKLKKNRYSEIVAEFHNEKSGLLQPIILVINE